MYHQGAISAPGGEGTASYSGEEFNQDGTEGLGFTLGPRAVAAGQCPCARHRRIHGWTLPAIHHEGEL